MTIGLNTKEGKAQEACTHEMEMMQLSIWYIQEDIFLFPSYKLSSEILGPKGVFENSLSSENNSTQPYLSLKVMRNNTKARKYELPQYIFVCGEW